MLMLSLYAGVLELLEEIPIDADLQTRHVHAAVGYCLGWIDMGAAGTSETSVTEPPPGACSNSRPHEGLTDDSIIDLAVLWSLLGNIDTRLGTGLDLTRRAEEKSNGALPLIVRFWGRIARYEALSNGTDLPRAVSIVIGMIEGNVCVKQLDSGKHDRWAPNDIMPLSHNYWDEQNNRAGLLFPLIAVGVWATYLNLERPLPIREWLNDVPLHNIAGPEVYRFFALLDGTEKHTDGSLLEEPALALRRIREEVLPPKDLFICHFRLLNALCSGAWGKPVGDALARIIAAQWLNVSENQRFALTSPAMYAPVLKEKCKDTSRVGFCKVASILKTAAMATGVSLAASGIEFLTQMERAEGSASHTA
jgi:hypothetical protein